MTPQENKTATHKVMGIAARMIADKACKEINELVDLRNLRMLHPYASQYVLEETIKELERRV